MLLDLKRPSAFRVSGVQNLNDNVRHIDHVLYDPPLPLFRYSGCSDSLSAFRVNNFFSLFDLSLSQATSLVILTRLLHINFPSFNLLNYFKLLSLFLQSSGLNLALMLLKLLLHLVDQKLFIWERIRNFVAFLSLVRDHTGFSEFLSLLLNLLVMVLDLLKH